jgi:hypothetical protein
MGHDIQDENLGLPAVKKSVVILKKIRLSNLISGYIVRSENMFQFSFHVAGMRGGGNVIL